MKISLITLALTAALCIGQSARAGGCGCALGFVVVPDSHGSSHAMYYQTNPTGDMMTVALETNSGSGIATGPLQTRDGVLPDNGDLRFVIGTNQHGEAGAAYIPVSSHFAQAQQ